jgi:predicted RecB family nuclease
VHYEVVDAKLARTAKARAVLQTAFYSRLLVELQGTEPTRPAEYRAVRKMTLRA